MPTHIQVIALIQGHLPLDIGITLPNIEFFSISGNQFIGSIPDSISNAIIFFFFFFFFEREPMPQILIHFN